MGSVVIARDRRARLVNHKVRRELLDIPDCDAHLIQAGFKPILWGPRQVPASRAGARPGGRIIIDAIAIAQPYLVNYGALLNVGIIIRDVDALYPLGKFRRG